MAEGERRDKRRDIELWIADTNQETLQRPLLSDKGHFSPSPPPFATAQRFSPSPPYYKTTRQSPFPPSSSPSPSPSPLLRQSSLLIPSPSLLKPPKPLFNNTPRNLLSVQGSLAKSHSTPPSPSYITLTTPSPSHNHLSHSVDNLVSIGSNTNTTTTTDYLERKHNTSANNATNTHGPLNNMSHFNFNTKISTGSPTGNHDTSTSDQCTSTSDQCTTTSDQGTTTSDQGANTSDLSSSTDAQTPGHPILTVQLLNILSEHIGRSKLPLLTTQLGLSSTDYDYATSSYRLPDTQALYILRQWYAMEDRSMVGLIAALKSIGLNDVAMKLQNGQLKATNSKKSTNSGSIATQRSLKSTDMMTSSSSRPYRSLAQCRGFSIHGEDGSRTVVIKRTGFGEDK